MKIYARFYHQTSHSQEHDTAHKLLSWVLKHEYGIEEYTLGKNSHGKPYLQSHPAIKVNLSHCKGLAVCAVGGNALGVDCEGIRRLREGVVRRVCTEEETAFLRDSANPDLDFTRLWTLKESFVKAVGRGVSYPMKNAAFAFDNGGIYTNVKGAAFWQYVIADRYIISACAAEPEEECGIFVISNL